KDTEAAWQKPVRTSSGLLWMVTRAVAQADSLGHRQSRPLPEKEPPAQGRRLVIRDLVGSLPRRFFRLLKAGADAARVVRRGAEEAEAHLVRRLVAEEHRPRRRKRVVWVLGTIVVDGLDVEASAGLDRDRLAEEVGFLPVVIPVVDGHERPRLAFGRH